MNQSNQSMSGKTCLITGATAGIGEATARELARRGATVVIVGRDQERCRRMVDALRRETGNASVEFLVADLTRQQDVRSVTKEFLAKHDRLHVLINNAGAIFAQRRESADGIEMTLALNHLAPFLLTTLLLDTLKRSAPARVITLSSSVHGDVKGFDFDDPHALTRRPRYGQSEFKSFLYCLTMPWGHPGLVQYAQSKLANLLFTTELARRLEGTGVTANALHPGYVKSAFTAGNGVLGWFMRIWSRLLGVSAEEGAKTPLHLACSPEVERISGIYFVKEKPAETSLVARDASAAGRLWQLSEAWTAGSSTRA